MIHPNDAAYILQNLYPVYLSYTALSKEQKKAVGGWEQHVASQLRLVFSQKLAVKGSLLYALAAPLNRLGTFLGKGHGEKKEQQLFAEAITSLESSFSYLKRKGRRSQIEALCKIVGGKQRAALFEKQWPQFAKEVRLLTHHHATLEQEIAQKLLLMKETIQRERVLPRQEDWKDFLAFHALIEGVCQREEKGEALFSMHQQLEKLCFRYDFPLEKGEHTLPQGVVAGVFLEGLAATLSASSHTRLTLPPDSDPQGALQWGLSESSFLALLLHASKGYSQLKEVAIHGEKVRHSLPPSGVKGLSELIASHPQLHKLSLSHLEIEGESWRPMGYALSQTPRLQRLHLSHLPLGEEGGEAFASSLHRCEELHFFHCSHCELSHLASNALGEALSQLPYLRTMDLSHNPFDSRGILGVLAVIRKGKVRQVNLSHTAIDDEGAIELAKAVAKHPKLDRLDVSFCEIGNVGAQSLQSVFEHHKGKLILEGNQLEKSAESSLEGIERSRKEIEQLFAHQEGREEALRLIDQILIFSQWERAHASKWRVQLLELLNQEVEGLKGLKSASSPPPAMSEEGGEERLKRRLYQLYLRSHPDPDLREALEAKKGRKQARLFTQTLHDLLERNQLILGNEGAKMLGRKIREGQVNSLTLKEKNVGVEGAKGLCVGILRSPSLLHLSIEENPLGDEGVQALGTALVANQSLKQLYLKNVGMGERGARGLGSGLAANRHVRDLHLHEKGLSEEAISSLLEQLHRNKGIREIQIKACHWSEKAARGLATWLSNSPLLIRVKIEMCAMDEEQVQLLAQGVEQSEQLEELHLVHCGVEDGGAKALHEALEGKYQFKHFNLKGNAISDSMKNQLRILSGGEYSFGV